MKMLSGLVGFLVGAVLAAAPALADGVMRPTEEAYPGDFLRLRTTRVEVTILGHVAMTTVEQEFVNEWDRPTNAVYSFPLPPDARATDFLFWSNDTLYRAVLKEKEQAPNPGTGEGGVDALLNKYLGSNALRVLLYDIPPGGIQRIRFQYIALCRYHDGSFTYRYPLDTDEFVSYPVEETSITVHVESAEDILSAGVKEYLDVRLDTPDPRHLEVRFDRAKNYPTKDFTVSYATGIDSLTVDFYSVNSDTMDGHFALFFTPRAGAEAGAVLGKNIVFLLDRSSSTVGPQLDQSKAAILECLKQLHQDDRFNVLAFDYEVQSWQATSVPPTPENVSSASSFVEGITAQGGSSLSSALQQALGTFGPDTLVRSIMLFSDGRSPIDPRQLRTINTAQVGIFPVGIGDDVSRQRLEMLAYLNYGFPTFLKLSDPIYDEVLTVFDQLNEPVLKDTRIELGPNAHDVLPQVPHTIYAGSRFFLTGRYHLPGATSLSLAGMAADGPRFLDMSLEMASQTNQQKFVESLWAKEKLDALEREIEVYGETDSLKRLMVAISLSYRIRCRYTAYIAEKTEVVISVDEGSIGISDLTATVVGEDIVLRWSLNNSRDVAGVNVYWAPLPAGEFVRLNGAELGTALFVDRNGSIRGGWYRLEVITTSGRRIWSRIFSTADAGLPDATRLYQNFPNPCNPATTIRYAIAAAGGIRVPVSITVYDLLGRAVREILAADQLPGTYEVSWDGRNAAGETVASGSYIIRLVAGRSVDTRTTLVLR